MASTKMVASVEKAFEGRPIGKDSMKEADHFALRLLGSLALDTGGDIGDDDDDLVEHLILHHRPIGDLERLALFRDAMRQLIEAEIQGHE